MEELKTATVQWVERDGGGKKVCREMEYYLRGREKGKANRYGKYRDGEE